MALGSLVVLLVLTAGRCDGDGGVPYSARDSTAGAFCDGPLLGVWQVALLVLPVAAAAAVGVVVVVRRRWAWAALSAAAGAGVLIALGVPVAALPAACSHADQRAYDAWVQGGRAGARPADCERY